MAKKRKKRNKPADLVNMEATVQKLQSLLTTPEMSSYMQSGAFRGVREKLVRINFDTIRNVMDRIPLVNAIIGTRVDQILPYCAFTKDLSQEGYTFERTDGKPVSKKDEAMMQQLSEFIDQTGHQYNDEREDDFADYVSMVIRETLTIDQIATEIQRNRKGEVAAFWLLDGATIKRVDPNSKDFKKNIRFVQDIEQKIYNEYTSEDLLFDYKNKRADLRFRGFGYSPVEQCIDMITTLLFGYTYIRDQLLRDRVPKGFISVMGDVGKTQLDSIRNYWYAAMSGAGGTWNIPILPSGKDGVGMDFKTLGQSNRDMEYHKLMMFISSIVAAVFSIDLAEMGIKADDSTALIGESSEPRIQASKDRGMASMMAFIEQHINKVIRKMTTDFRFKLVGFEKEDEKRKWEIRKTQIETSKTINEIREEDGDEPIEDDYANVVLNVQGVQIYQASQMGGEGGFGEEGMGEGEPGGEEPEPEESAEDEGGEVDWGAAFGKSRDESGEKVVRIIIE